MQKIIIISILLFACGQGKKEKVFSYITNSSNKSWDLINKSTGVNNIGYNFNCNGEFKLFYIDGENKARLGGPPGYKRVWNLLNDSILIIMDAYKLKISYINNDTMILTQLDNTDTVTLKSSKEHNELFLPKPSSEERIY